MQHFFSAQHSFQVLQLNIFFKNCNFSFSKWVELLYSPSTLLLGWLYPCLGISVSEYEWSASVWLTGVSPEALVSALIVIFWFQLLTKMMMNVNSSLQNVNGPRQTLSPCFSTLRVHIGWSLNFCSASLILNTIDNPTGDWFSWIGCYLPSHEVSIWSNAAYPHTLHSYSHECVCHHFRNLHMVSSSGNPNSAVRIEVCVCTGALIYLKS